MKKYKENVFRRIWPSSGDFVSIWAISISANGSTATLVGILVEYSSCKKICMTAPDLIEICGCGEHGSHVSCTWAMPQGCSSLIVQRSVSRRSRNHLRHRSDPVRCAIVNVQRVALRLGCCLHTFHPIEEKHSQ
jgi:hypothetical protein